MAEILYDPDTTVEDVHKCWKELPGKLVDTMGVSPKYYTGVKSATVVLCSCGEVYRAIYSGYSNLGCKYERLGWWESRKYKKRAGKW